MNSTPKRSRKASLWWALNIRVPLNRLPITMRHPVSNAGRMPMRVDMPWNMGNDEYSTSSAVSPTTRAKLSPLLTARQCGTITPLDGPVVPDVKPTVQTSR